LKLKKNGGVREEKMTGYRESSKRALTLSELDYIKERMRTEKKPDVRRIADYLGVHHLSVSRVIGALRFLEKMTEKHTRESKGNT